MSKMKLNELIKKANDCLDKGDFRNTLKWTKKIIELNLGIDSIFAGSALFINIGMAMKDSSILKRGIDLLEDNFDEIYKGENYRGSLYYNLGNGFSNSFYMEKMGSKKECFGCFNETQLDKAIEYYRKSLNCKMNGGILSRILVNLGNCYDNQGRVIDALEQYDKALKINSNFGMALANKGSAILHYAHLISEKKLRMMYYVKSRNLIVESLEKGIIPEAKPGFEKLLVWLDDKLENTELVENYPNDYGIKIESDSKFKEFFISFCLENKLYLNVCNYCQECQEAIGDPIVIPKMIVELKKDKNTNFFVSDPFLILSGYLNQIKQDYISARFLLALSHYKEFGFEFIDKKVSLIDTLDYRKYNIYIQLMKTSFMRFYNILDKIAFFINEYLEIGESERNISFHRIWYSNPIDILKDIRNTRNISPNAIYKIHKDLYDNGYFSYLKELRDALTHRFVNIYHFEKEDSERMSEESLFNKTLELSKFTRNAIMYLINFVYIKESKKEEDLKGFIPPMFAIEIPDELKE